MQEVRLHVHRTAAACGFFPDSWLGESSEETNERAAAARRFGRRAPRRPHDDRVAPELLDVRGSDVRVKCRLHTYKTCKCDVLFP